jgi:predicted naringenin-chalcone synthase
MIIFINGIGTALPPHQITQADAAAIAQRFACETPAQERLFQSLYRRAGVELNCSDGDLSARQSFYGPVHPTTLDRMLQYEEHTRSLAVASAREALRDAGVAPGRITHLVTISCTGFYAPGFDVALIQQLGLPADTARTHLGFMGCQAVLNGLRVARAFLEADPSACVLLCAVELCSLHHQYGWDAEKIVANALFADGAGALVALAGASRPGDGFELVAAGSTLIADSEEAMTWRIGNHGFTMTLSPRVPELIGQHLRPWLDGWLARHGLNRADVGSWAVHPGGPRILSAFGEATGLDRSRLEPSYRALARYGNMSSPTILFILEHLRRIEAPRPCVALAFGPGLTVEAALLG